MFFLRVTFYHVLHDFIKISPLFPLQKDKATLKVYVACKQYTEDYSEIKLRLHTHSMPKVPKTKDSADVGQPLISVARAQL